MTEREELQSELWMVFEDLADASLLQDAELMNTTYRRISLIRRELGDAGLPANATGGVRRRSGGERSLVTSGASEASSAAEAQTTTQTLEPEVQREWGYAVKVGARLRAIRRQKHLSLQDVEASSDHEFKASVLGAYERGEQAISVPRLQRLARFYRVQVDQLLPTEEEPEGRAALDESVVGLAERLRVARPDGRPVTIDLTAVDQLGGVEGDLLSRYLRVIQVQRGEDNGRMLTIRRDDLRALACILDCHPDQVPIRLDSLGLCLVR